MLEYQTLRCEFATSFAPPLSPFVYLKSKPSENEVIYDKESLWISLCSDQDFQ